MTNPDKLPDDIAAAIDAFDGAAQARGWEACMRSVAAADAAELEHAERRAALTAAILARLTAAAEDDAEATCLHVRAEKTAEEIAYWQDAARHAEAERDHFRDKLDEMFGQLMLAEGSCATLRARAERLEKGVRDFLAGDYPHPRSYRPMPCPHGVGYWHECQTCNDTFLQSLLDGAEEAKP